VYGVYDVVGGVVRPAAAGVLGGAGRTLLTPHTLQTLASPSTEKQRIENEYFCTKHKKYVNLPTYRATRAKWLYFQAGDYKEMSS
jgi:hypothetical protein